MAASHVVRETEFESDLADLRREYPFIDSVIDDFCDLLRAGYDLPESPIDRTLLPNMYTVNLDYPPLGEDGLAHFQIQYFQTEQPWPNIPYRTYRLLNLIERRK